MIYDDSDNDSKDAGCVSVGLYDNGDNDNNRIDYKYFYIKSARKSISHNTVECHEADIYIDSERSGQLISHDFVLQAIVL